ncbi:V-type ATP synthase subunit D [Helicovermis profundi]|uniref:V-type ATP synthase subunit D n=1 Tax=Helicovermis profundi TaxID=3065157 RepID=A0AAU9E6D9_9FIRM|nr:V-type ATP synthase subunit D [Clostridia bacterium S502]
MQYSIAPTKANLIKAKGMLKFSLKGFELLDKKRNVLIREMMGLVKRAEEVQNKIQDIFDGAYDSLRFANITLGLNNVEDIAISIVNNEEFDVLSQSVMGVEIPKLIHTDTEKTVNYGLFRTNAALDEAVVKFNDVRMLIYELGEIETSVYKLAMEIKKTQKRANALDKIQIPKFQELVKFIQDVLEEKEREDFFRLKKVKKKHR